MKKKSALTIVAVLLVVLSLLGAAYFYINQKLNPKEMEFSALEWSKDLNWGDICSRCRSQNCTARADSFLLFPSLEEIRGRINGSYIMCVEIIDGVDRYKTETASLSIPSQNFVTSNSLDPTKSHSVEVCCSLIVECETDNLKLQLIGRLRNLMGLTETDYYQVCKTKTISPGCA